jgi:hypothetical protein
VRSWVLLDISSIVHHGTPWQKNAIAPIQQERSRPVINPYFKGFAPASPSSYLQPDAFFASPLPQFDALALG